MKTEEVRPSLLWWKPLWQGPHYFIISYNTTLDVCFTWKTNPTACCITTSYGRESRRKTSDHYITFSAAATNSTTSFLILRYKLQLQRRILLLWKLLQCFHLLHTKLSWHHRSGHKLYMVGNQSWDVCKKKNHVPDLNNIVWSYSTDSLQCSISIQQNYDHILITYFYNQLWPAPLSLWDWATSQSLPSLHSFCCMPSEW